MYAKLFIGFFAALLLVPAAMAFAQGVPPSQFGGGTPVPPSQFGSSKSQTLQNPLKFDTVCGFIKQVFQAVMIIGIPVATFFIIYAGFLFVVARGRPEALTKAKTNALYVVIGVAVFLGAWVLAQIIGATLQALGGPVIGSC